jgi:hypothetical protein
VSGWRGAFHRCVFSTFNGYGTRCVRPPSLLNAQTPIFVLFLHTFWISLRQERETAKTLFTTAEGVPNALADKTAATVSTEAAKSALATDEPKPIQATAKAGRLMSKEEQARVKEAIAKATSVEEIRRLEQTLKEGYLPNMDSVGA